MWIEKHVCIVYEHESEHTVTSLCAVVCLHVSLWGTSKEESSGKAVMEYDASLCSLLWSLCQQTEITAVRGEKLCSCPIYTEMVFCVHVCVAKGCRGCVCVCGGVPVIKSPVRADQDPVNQASV